jgi:hypothetical protein
VLEQVEELEHLEEQVRVVGVAEAQGSPKLSVDLDAFPALVVVVEQHRLHHPPSCQHLLLHFLRFLLPLF